MPNEVVGNEQWRSRRIEFLKKEKEFNIMRDQLSAERQQLPWRKIDKAYSFESNKGKLSLSQLFEDKSQLVAYHFMLGPGWESGCPSCSLILDNISNVACHLAARDVSLKVISQAPLDEINTFKERMGWEVDWVSSFGSEFNFDFEVSFTQEDLDTGNVSYNYVKGIEFPATEAPGASTFKKVGSDVFHCYSTFSRGLDMLMGSYHLLDIAPDGRNEQDLPFSMAWVKLHDSY